MDISVSAVALVAVSPILVYTAYKIKKEDNGSVIFKQNRTGMNDELFEMYKFRSMKVGNKIVGNHKDKDPYEDWKGRVPDDFVFKSASASNPNVT